MQVIVQIDEYDRREGISFDWDDEWVVRIGRDQSGPVISANPGGLRGLAAILLTLAQDGVPNGAHVHIDSFTGLPEDSDELLLQRL